MSDIIYLLIQLAKDICCDLSLPVACELCKKITEKKQKQNQDWQKKGRGVSFSGDSKGQAILCGADRKALHASDAFGIANCFSVGYANGCGADLFTFFAVDAVFRGTLDLERAYQGK